MEASTETNSKPSAATKSGSKKSAGSSKEPSRARAPLNLRTFAVGYQLSRNSPELLNRVPEDLRNRLQMGDPSVLSEILRTQPELFRDKMLGRLEDEAFSQLLSAREPSPPQPSETSPEPSLA
jgi:hypothetical protein